MTEEKKESASLPEPWAMLQAAVVKAATEGKAVMAVLVPGGSGLGTAGVGFPYRGMPVADLERLLGMMAAKLLGQALKNVRAAGVVRKPAEYIITRMRNPVSVLAQVIYNDGTAGPLPHLVLHSPTGFEYGYGGSGPADLARSIIGHYTGNPEPLPTVYQAFKLKFLAATAAEGDVIRISAAAIDAFLATLAGGA